MTDLKLQLEQINTSPARTPKEVNEDVARILKSAGYSIVIKDYERPWGGFNQLDNKDANRFVEKFFSDITPNEARLGNPNSELSPKILVVAPKQRLSWQYHNRRVERWVYLTEGGYFKSLDDNQGELQLVQSGNVVQFRKSERHRLVGADTRYTIVAEIWQHIDPTELSNESDIMRLADDYQR